MALDIPSDTDRPPGQAPIRSGAGGRLTTPSGQPSVQSGAEGRRVEEALAFDDVLLVPAYSQILPSPTDTRTRLARTISLNIPIISFGFQST